jgi:hypothetical protein
MDGKIYLRQDGKWVEPFPKLPIEEYAAAYYDYHDDKARQSITDPVQREYFEKWLNREVCSPDPKDKSLRQVYDAIVDLAMVGCG